MQFDKQFHGGRSPVVVTGHGDEASRYSTEISALPVSSEDDATRRSTVAAAARFIVAARHPSTEIRISFRAGHPV